MEKVSYIVIPYIINKETRYKIVSKETGEIIDDAQGYGYKTIGNAHRAYAYKTRDKSKDSEYKAKQKHIRRWLKSHQYFVDDLDDAYFRITVKGSFGRDAKFNSKVVSQLLEEHNLEIDFKPSELLKVYLKR